MTTNDALTPSQREMVRVWEEHMGSEFVTKDTEAMIPQLQDILPGVLYHHERFDGRGYPEGLAGDDIPLVARLISLADAFDAMSSNRTYRPLLSRPDVIRQIHDGAGTQFDPNLAPVFVDLDFSEYDGMSAETRAFELEGPRNRDEAA